MIPESINPNTILAYQPSEGTEVERKVKSECFDWDLNHPKTLVNLCLEKLSENWHGIPRLEDLVPQNRDLFLQILNTNVPVQILVDNIQSDIFWKRCYSSKWNDALSVRIDTQKRWINIFMERHYAEILENMNPRQYDPEKVNDLVKLCGPFIQSLQIRSFIPADLPVQRMFSPEMANLITGSEHSGNNKSQVANKEEYSRDHISLHPILGSLNNLVELHVTFQQKNIGTEYRRDQFQFTNNDAKNLARGLENCAQLKILNLNNLVELHVTYQQKNIGTEYRRDQFQFTNNDAKKLARGLANCAQLKILKITRSDLDCQRIKYILRGLSDNKKLETLDFSHCKIGNDGLSSISKYIARHENLRNIILTDNKFGPLGAESLSQALNYVDCGIRNLDLRLNNNLGSEGVAFIAVSLARGCNLTSLNISGCGITPRPLPKTPPGVWSTTNAESPPTCGDLLARAIGLVKTPLRSLDISVNNVGSPSDETLSNAICLSFLIDINLIRSGMGSKPIAIAESAAAAQRLRREAEKGIKFRRSAGKVLHARRVARGMNIDTDPLLLAQQLSARPSIVSVASEEGIYSIQTQPLPSDFGFVPALKTLPSSRESSITGPPTSRRSSHHTILEPVKEIRKTALIRRSSDGSLLKPRSANTVRHIKIFVSNGYQEDDY